MHTLTAPSIFFLRQHFKIKEWLMEKWFEAMHALKPKFIRDGILANQWQTNILIQESPSISTGSSCLLSSTSHTRRYSSDAPALWSSARTAWWIPPGRIGSWMEAGLTWKNPVAMMGTLIKGCLVWQCSGVLSLLKFTFCRLSAIAMWFPSFHCSCNHSGTWSFWFFLRSHNLRNFAFNAFLVFLSLVNRWCCQQEGNEPRVAWAHQIPVLKTNCKGTPKPQNTKHTCYRSNPRIEMVELFPFQVRLRINFGGFMAMGAFLTNCWYLNRFFGGIATEGAEATGVLGALLAVDSASIFIAVMASICPFWYIFTKLSWTL